MKLNVLSDLHLSVDGLPHPRNDADVVVLAGDIARPRESAEWARKFDKPVLYVLGNHEFYGGSIEATADELKRLCAGSNVHVLDDDEVEIDGVRFLGSTLWTDFGLLGDVAKGTAMVGARNLMRDFSRIRIDDATNVLFTPEDSTALYERHAEWLDRRLDVRQQGPT
ncbi:MAG TPA: metallophosphoesterase, partial [Burkholderiaceae bacterium]|nr:metallophosphoesterase [Burkholderiaceae bacterium]